MNLIPCALNCTNQKDGYCNQCGTPVVTNVSGGCPHFVELEKANSLTKEPDVHQKGYFNASTASRME